MNTRQLTAIQIPAIDLTGNGGLGWEDLKDPHKGVAMFAVMPVGTVIGDYVELFWNGQPIQKLFTDPDRPSIDFSVLPQDIPDEPEISEVFYRITPADGGTPDDSPIRQVRIKRSVPGSQDPDNHTPYINENLAPVENLPLNIEMVADLPLTAPPWNNMHEGDVLRLFWSSNEFVAENPPLPPGEEGKPQTVMVTPALQQAAGNLKSLVVNYEIRDLVNNWSRYSVAAFTEVNTPVLRAAAVTEAPAGVLDPLQAVAGATVVVAYPDMRETDEIHVRWNGREDVTIPVSQPGNSMGSVDFTVTPDAIAPVLGNSAEVRYRLTRSGASMESQALELEVLALPSSSLPVPRIEQALNGNVLHVASLSNDADLTVRAWPFIKAGQRVWLRFEGTRADGTANNWYHSLWQNFAITSDADQHTHVALTELQKLKEGSSLRVIMEVSFDDGLSRTAFPVRQLTITFSYPVTGKEDWETFSLQSLPFDTPVPCANGMLLEVKAGQASIVDVSEKYSYFYERTLQVSAEGTMTLTFSEPVRHLSFIYAMATSDSNVLTFFNASGAVIRTASLHSSADHTSEGSYDLNQPCVSCRFALARNPIAVLLDHLSWKAWDVGTGENPGSGKNVPSQTGSNALPS